jgi:small subunit ribosomal protein S8
MSMTDPISDMLTRLRNGIRVRRDWVEVNASRLSRAILEVLQREGYVEGTQEVLGTRGFPMLRVHLKYDRDGEPVIGRIARVSKPGCRVYRGVGEIPRILNGLGITVLTTSRGVLSDREARAQGVGGEVLCEIW